MNKRKYKVLAVGEHPVGTSGNSGMFHSILSQIDTKKYDVSALTIETAGFDPKSMLFTPPAVSMVNVSLSGDPYGQNMVLDFAGRADFQILLFVGIDLWQYHESLKRLAEVRDKRGFKIAWIMPYDLNHVRKEMVEAINLIDYPLIYTESGQKLVAKSCPHSSYFRPPFQFPESFSPRPDNERQKIRKTLFPTFPQDAFIFAFIGVNQKRKDPQKLIKAFVEVHKKHPNARLYLHTELNRYYNLPQYLADCGAVPGTANAFRGGYYSVPDMAAVYNAADCLVNCSYQEGLSWTPLEAMLSGTSVIVSDSTAHKDIVTPETGYLVPCETQTYQQIKVPSGTSYVDAKSCRWEDIADVMLQVLNDSDSLRKQRVAAARKFSEKWVAGSHNINDSLDKIVSDSVAEAQERAKIRETRKGRMLFVQHSSAGDVLMSTQCFEGLRKKHPELKLDYMTQRQYQGIVIGNPYIDEVLDWEIDLLGCYEVVYNPHGEKILPGGWNNLDVKLYSMYPYFCGVDPGKMLMQSVPLTGTVREEFDSVIGGDPYIVVHTTGGSIEYRTYKHFDLVLRAFKTEHKVVQVGGEGDLLCKTTDMDLRGRTSYHETAWVLKNAACFVGIDSFPMHLAGALGVPMVALFGPAPSRVTGPRFQEVSERGYKDIKLVCLEPDMLDVCSILSHCWGDIPQGKQKCVTPCINTIHPMKVKKALKEVML